MTQVIVKQYIPFVALVALIQNRIIQNSFVFLLLSQHYSQRIVTRYVAYSQTCSPYTCSAPQPWSASRMFDGGSIEGMNSRARYPRPMKPTSEPAMYRSTPSCSRSDPTKI